MNKINYQIYLVYKGYGTIGYANEIRFIDKIQLDKLVEFLVKSEDNEEIIEIKTEGKEFLFFRDDSNSDNLAVAMSKVIDDIKA